MPTYIIERDISATGEMSRQELRAIAQKSCEVLIGKHLPKEMGDAP